MEGDTFLVDIEHKSAKDLIEYLDPRVKYWSDYAHNGVIIPDDLWEKLHIMSHLGVYLNGQANRN